MTLDLLQKKADLHIHTHFSDSLLSPKQVIENVKTQGLDTIAITDHDSILGIDEAIDCGDKAHEIIPGVELSTIFQEIDVHILGYYIDYRNEDLVRYLTDLQHFRENRARQMIEKLAKYGIKLEYDLIRNIVQQAAVGRPHIATAMKEKGYVSTIDEAFYRFIGYHGPCYVPKKEIEIREAIQIIKEFGGIPVLAHPGVYECEELIPKTINDGIEGIEVWHPEHTRRCTERLLLIANEYHLLVTGGSDCHGGRKGGRVLIGQVCLNDCYVRELKRRAGIIKNGEF